MPAARAKPMLGTGLRYILTVLVGMSLSMVMAYGAVRWLTKGTVYVSDIDAGAADRAWNLRAAANELTRLANEFSEAVPASPAVITPTTRQWLLTEFTDGLSSVDRTLASGKLVEEPPSRGLRDACGRLAALGNHPDDPALRAAAFADLKRSLADLDAYLRSAHLQRRVALPTTPLR